MSSAMMVVETSNSTSVNAKARTGVNFFMMKESVAGDLRAVVDHGDPGRLDPQRTRGIRAILRCRAEPGRNEAGIVGHLDGQRREVRSVIGWDASPSGH